MISRPNYNSTDSLYAQLNDYLSKQLGLWFDDDRKDQFKKGIDAAAKENGFQDPAKYIKWLMNASLSKEQVETLSGHLTVGESYFFREIKSFEAFENQILPQLLSQRQKGEKKIRIWSAACSSGEEPYSIAMIIDKHKKRLAHFSILILGTDINRDQLAKARKGNYREWSFRNISPHLKKRHFVQTGQYNYEIRSHLKEMVVFDYANLAQSCCPELLNRTDRIDVIFCRNVLLYFSPRTIAHVVENFHNCLNPGGYLILSPNDAVNVSHPGLERTPIQHVPIFRKRGRYSSQLSSSNPPPGKPSYKHALQYYRQGFYPKAQGILLSLNALPDQDTTKTAAIHQLLARTYFRLGKFEEAKESCEKALLLDKHHTQTRYLSACILLELQQPRDAAFALKQCLYLDARFIPALFALGRLAHRKGNISEAHHYFDKALSLLAPLPPAHQVPGMEKPLTVGRLKEIIEGMKQIDSLNK